MTLGARESSIYMIYLDKISYSRVFQVMHDVNVTS